MKQEIVDKMFVDSYYGSREADSERIVNVLQERFSVRLSRSDAVKFWENYSDTYSAGWLSIESDDEIASVFKNAYDTFIERNEIDYSAD